MTLVTEFSSKRYTSTGLSSSAPSFENKSSFAVSLRGYRSQ